MKNFRAISCISIMVASFAMAEKAPNPMSATPQTTKTPGMTVTEMFTLRQMFEDFKTKDSKNFSFRSKQHEICVKNNRSKDEVCVHTADLAEMLLEAYKTKNAELIANVTAMLRLLGTMHLPELNVDLQFQGSPIHPVLSTASHFRVSNPSESFICDAKTQPSKDTPVNLESKLDVYVKDTNHVILAGTYDLRTNTLDYFATSFKNLRPKNPVDENRNPEDFVPEDSEFTD
jgi:hypothetical protein